MTSGGTPPLGPGPDLPPGSPAPDPAWNPGGYPPYPAGPSAAPGYPGAGYPGGYPGSYPGAPAPAPRPSTWRKWWPALVIAIAAALGAAYPIIRDAQKAPDAPPSVSASQAGAEDCAVDGAAFLSLPKQAADEPTIHVPIMAGWTNRDFRTEEPRLAAIPTLRAMIFKDDPENGALPSVEVDLAAATDSDAALADTMFARGNTANPINQRTTGPLLRRSSGTVCGATVYWGDFAGTPRSENGQQAQTTVMTVADGAEGKRWVAFATISTWTPDGPAYLAQRDALIKGFHLTVP
jgi:hypothetical protein